MVNKHFTLTASSWSILALIRFLLAVIVLISHIRFFGEVPHELRYIEILGGRAAVIGFFLISGLSIGYSYANSSTGYLKRRFLRIYPLYFFAILFAVLLRYSLGTYYELPGLTIVGSGLLTNLSNFFFLQEFLTLPVAYNNPAWSISIEVFFYLMVPILAQLKSRVIYPFIFLSMAFYVLTHKYFDWMLWGYGALIYAWAWLTGYLIMREPNKMWAFALAGLGVLIVSLNKIIAPEAMGWLTYLVVAIGVFFSGYTAWDFRKATKKTLNWLGDISYPLYLFHFPVMVLTFHFGIKNMWGTMAIVFVLVVVFNYVFDKVLKEKFWKPITNYVLSNLTAHPLYSHLKVGGLRLYQAKKGVHK